ncbi:MAG: transketolase, partial [Candidatus Neomarinimicrobiota bacterium]
MPSSPLTNQIKGLVMDMVRRANSGHTGGAFSSADFAMLLFRDVLRYDPGDPTWPNRDRFVLSAGHESALLYSLLHLIGYLDRDDLLNFRQLGSRTPGHPEVGLTPGVEATSGPLGQGVAMAVGMAVAEEMLRARLGSDTTNHNTYCLCGDGDLQEPVALGACELAGHWRLGRLIMYYDRNRVQISGGTERVDSTNIDQLFISLGWQVLEVDGHDHDAIREALAQALLHADQPSLIIGNTIMAHGTATMEGSADTHGAPLPPKEITATKKKLGLDPEAAFQVTDEALTEMHRRQPRLREQAAAWRQNLEQRRVDPEFDARWRSFFEPADPARLPWPQFEPGVSIATRKAFGQALDAVAEELPNLVGGSADLDPSNNTANFA